MVKVCQLSMLYERGTNYCVCSFDWILLIVYINKILLINFISYFHFFVCLIAGLIYNILNQNDNNLNKLKLLSTNAVDHQVVSRLMKLNDLQVCTIITV